MEQITVVRLNGGWYDFSLIKQEGHYIKVHALNCMTDKKAISQARRIVGDKNAPVMVVSRG